MVKKHKRLKYYYSKLVSITQQLSMNYTRMNLYYTKCLWLHVRKHVKTRVSEREFTNIYLVCVTCVQGSDPDRVRNDVERGGVRDHLRASRRTLTVRDGGRQAVADQRTGHKNGG